MPRCFKKNAGVNLGTSLWPNRLEKAENSIVVDESLGTALVNVLSDV